VGIAVTWIIVEPVVIGAASGDNCAGKLTYSRACLKKKAAPGNFSVLRSENNRSVSTAGLLLSALKIFPYN
jgi:hypothetical protein